MAFSLCASSSKLAFAPTAACTNRANLSTLPNFNADSARTVVQQGRKRARSLMYGAGGAFRGLANRRQRFEHLMRASFSSGDSNRGGSNNNKNGGGGGGQDDEYYVDPSWGVSPGVQVLLRGKADGPYRAGVANLMAMSVALTGKPNPSFVDPSVPVVLILSWMGARQKHLTKYRKFYEDLGYEVHFIFNDLKTAIFPPASQAQARRVGQFIEDQPDGRPVFVHAFSIGTGIYGILLDSLKNESERFDNLRRRVTGVVFDSGPAPIFPKDVAKGLHTVCPMISKKLWEPVASLFFYLTKARTFYGRSEDALRKTQFPVPQLYFYSGDDKVISNLQGAVEEFIDKNKQRGVEVYNKFWENSVHASHLKVHPDEYLSNLSSFLNRCMEVRNASAQLAIEAPSA